MTFKVFSYPFWCCCVLSSLGFWGSAAQALPGQPAETVAAWIKDHPILQPSPGETLLIRKQEADGSRFTFQAEVTPPGRIVTPLDKETIRTERITLFETNGLTPDQLAATIRDIYGSDIEADFTQAPEVLRYPSAEVLDAPVTQDTFLQRAIQGVIRQGAQFVYWLELTQNPDGSVQQGKIVLFEAEWLPKVQEEVKERYQLP